MAEYSEEEKKKTGKQGNISFKKSRSYPVSRMNLTGIPENTKNYFEQKSGMSFDDVRVHYHSDKPEKVQALAYTQGSDVYIGPGQEKYLKHELGHVVQQMQGRVTADTQVNGLPVNSDPALEREADQL